MGRSKSSCFKIIACGGDDSADNEDTHQAPSPPEYKGSSDKRRWSFRKRSARHRVLNNIIETPTSLNKEIPEIVTNNLETQPNETLTEKNSAITWAEETPVAISKEADITVAPENAKVNDLNLDESVILVIQASIRAFLAKKQMKRVKNVVKLQAAVRGHLVRTHAVGTLRCVQAIVKMQGLVRARQARISSEAKPSEKETSVTKPGVGYISIEKLLHNKFANQLLESTPRNKAINIKCDLSSKSDSSWNWLERWMLISSNKPIESPSENCEYTDSKIDDVQETLFDQKNSFIEKKISLELISGEIKKLDSDSETDETEPNEVFSEREMEIEQPAVTVKESDPEEVQSKSEEVKIATVLARSTSSRKTNAEAVSFSVENEIMRSEGKEVKVGGSECGTELSVTSTLDSPDGFDTGIVDAELEIEIKNEGNYEFNSFHEVDNETKAEPDSEISNIILVETEKLDNGADAEESSVLVTNVASELEKPKLETKESDEIINLSMNASPRSQMTVPEFQVTPSSQTSIKANKKTKNDEKSSNKKTKSSSAGKLSPLNQNQNSGSKNSLDGFPKDLKTGKRRNSFGSGKSDYNEQEPRDSSSSNNALPSYMQATESARMKALSNLSPKNSPDLQEKEIYVKKRHSLPGSNGKQGSPRLQHSKSLAPQDVKANGHPQERKWQR